MRRFVAAALSVGLFAAPVAAQDATADAQRLLTGGVEAFDARDYDRALVELRQSLAAAPSPNTRLWIARSLQRLGRNAEAALEFERTIRETRERNDPRYDATRSAASMELLLVSRSIGRIQLEPRPLPQGMQVVADGRGLNADETADAFPVRPGPVTVIVRDRDGADVHNERLTVSAGDVINVNWQSRPLARDAVVPLPSESSAGSDGSSSSLAGLGWTSIGIGIGSLAASGTLMFLTQRQFDATREACGPAVARGCTDEQLVLGRTMQTATNIFLGAGIGTTALGLLLEIVDYAGHRGSSGATATWRLSGQGLLIRF